MKLECFALHADPPPLKPARPTRAWMDATGDRFAYRCLPLNIANCYGWEILSPFNFVIQWNGGDRSADIKISSVDGKGYRQLPSFVVSHFNHGVVTFHTGYLFRTDPGWDLLAMGPTNEPKDGITALAGVIETDWLPFPFTMNWKFTRPGEVRFSKGEPICLIVPMQRGVIEGVTPEIHDLSERPELVAEFEAWKTSRTEFLAKLKQGDEETVKEAWQRFYFQGRAPTQETRTPGHSSKLRVAQPVDKRKRRSAPR